MPPPVRFGLVGLGTAARELHVPALARVDGVELVAGCDPEPERRAWFEGAAGAAAHTSLDELLARERPDAVIVATPPEAHVEGCTAALEHGAHVFCEKPLAASLDQATGLVAAAERAGRALAVNHSLREAPIFRALRDAIGSGEHGPLVFCQLWQLMDLAPADEPTAWRAAAAGSALLEAGIHLADLLVYLFGAVPEAVYARRGGEDDALVLMTVEFPGGRLGQLTIDRVTQAATRYAEARADCERASLRASWGGRASLRLGKRRAERAGVMVEYGAGGLAWSERGLRRRTLARNPRAPAVHGTAQLLRGFAEAVRAGGEPPCSGREALVTLELIAAAYRSAATGERVVLGGVPQQVVQPPGGGVPGQG